MELMYSCLRILVHTLVIRPLVRGLLGMNVYGGDQLPAAGPAVIAANHNSHLDTLLLMSLLPPGKINHVRPAAAMDYFHKGSFVTGLLARLFRVIPVRRADINVRDGDPLAGCSRALAEGDILVIYPEGTRGDPGCMAPFKPGIAHLARRHPDVPVIPVFISGLEMVLPRGAYCPVPYVCNVSVGSPIYWQGDKRKFMDHYRSEMESLKASLPHHQVMGPSTNQVTSY